MLSNHLSQDLPSAYCKSKRVDIQQVAGYNIFINYIILNLIVQNISTPHGESVCTSPLLKKGDFRYE
jgi:hypothetical protein